MLSQFLTNLVAFLTALPWPVSIAMITAMAIAVGTFLNLLILLLGISETEVPSQQIHTSRTLHHNGNTSLVAH